MINSHKEIIGITLHLVISLLLVAGDTTLSREFLEFLHQTAGHHVATTDTVNVIGSACRIVRHIQIKPGIDNYAGSRLNFTLKKFYYLFTR